jgi:hypothetical protein
VKQRTRIASAIMIGLGSCNVFSASISVLTGAFRGTLFETADLAFAEVLVALAHIAILAGWIYLLKSRAWAWTMLVWLTAIFSSGMLLSPGLELIVNLSPGSGLPMMDHSSSFPWVIVFMPFPFGWAYIPALVLLLKDKPSEWSKTRPDAVPSAPQPGDLKRRTSIVAWICLVYSAISFLSLPLAFVIFRHRPGSWLSLFNVPGALVWALWIPLLGKRVWAWWALTVTYAAMSVLDVWGVAQAPQYYAAQHKALAHPYHAMIPGAVMLVLLVLIPLWALLSDRPSGWANPQSEIPNPK